MSTVEEPIVEIDASPLLGPDDNGLLMTPEEFDAIEDAEDGWIYELINGVLVVNPIPLGGETDPNEELGFYLRLYQKQHPQGAALDKTMPQQYVRMGRSRRQPDRVIWAGLGRTPSRKNDLPTIVVEFVSKRRRDRQRDYVAKRNEYMAAGIPEYWIIDRFRRTLTVVRTGPNGITEQIIPENEVFRTPLLPGFELDLKAIFKVADDWRDQ